jgi:AbrB family looped-hinge helix DNA binding protein
MGALATTRLSSKGQVVIPEEIRESLGLKTGDQFVVVGDRDVVILKAITPPRLEEFDTLVRGARRAARRVGLKPANVRSAIARARATR